MKNEVYACHTAYNPGHRHLIKCAILFICLNILSCRCSGSDQITRTGIRKMNLIDIITVVMLVSAEIRGWIALRNQKKEENKPPFSLFYPHGQHYIICKTIY